MSYILPILTFLLVLSPLYIPVGVTIADAIHTLRRRTPVVAPAAARRLRRLEPAGETN